MKSWSETLVLTQPLRDVRLTASQAAGAAPAAGGADELRASYERGRIDGETALNGQLLRQRADLMDLQNGLLTALRETLPAVRRECEASLVALTLEVAQKLVAGLPITTEMVEATVQEALTQVEETGEITVELHPDDLALLQRANESFTLPHGGADRIQFAAAAGVTRGGCLVQTRFGVIDARRETKLGRLEQALRA